MRLGRGLFRLQMGERLGMPTSRPMPGVAVGVSELRVKGENGSFRAFYFIASSRGVLVFHAFVKKTQRTPPLEIELARKRLKELLDA
jgi:phage-related protein